MRGTQILLQRALRLGEIEDGPHALHMSRLLHCNNCTSYE